MKSLGDLVDPADQAALEQLFAETLDKGHALGELGYRTRDGRRVPIRVVCNRCELDGNAYIVSAGLDMTEHRALEQQFLQMQKMEAVGRLAGGVAHDFNNILTVINGYAEILLAKHPLEEDPQRQELELIHQSGMRAGALTRQLLAFSRQQMMNPREVQLNDLVLDLDKMLRRLIGEDVQLTLELDPGLGVVQADPSQLEQVLLNLAVNARDAMPNGGRLSIATSSIQLDESTVGMGDELKPGPHVVLTVADSGIGMSEEVKARIFEPFFTTKALGQGTGLGLSTVIGIVRQSGGQIQVFSEPGAGATFKIYLPRVDGDAAAHAQAPGAGVEEGGTETVVLVEDDASVRQFATLVLARRGYRVLGFRDGDAALDALDAELGPMHLLVTDVIMPGMNGRVLAERMTERLPALRVLFTSGYTENVIVHHGVLNAGLDFLPKPYSGAALLRKVREILDRT